MASTSGTKRNFLTLSEKLAILKESDSFRGSKVELAKKFKIPVTTLQYILKKRDSIEKSCNDLGKSAKKRKTLKTSSYEKIENVLLKWYTDTRAAKIPVNGVLIKEKAREIAQHMKIDFSASNGWMDRFKKRHNLVFGTFHGESDSVNMETVEEWKRKLPEIIKEYSLKDIFNADETGLFYNLMPNSGYVVRGEKCHGGKLSKMRLTVLLCANADGSEKIEPLVIGKSKNPRCFKHIKSFPTKYAHNKKSWMTGSLFENYLYDLDRAMGRQKRKILLFVDQCTSHTAPKTNLKNVRLEFFPPNCTSLLQPLDLGVIRSFKFAYRTQLVRKALCMLESDKLEDASKCKINVLEAMQIILSSWNSVTDVCLKNAFRKAGFQVNQFVDEPIENVVNDIFTLNVNFPEYVECDNDVFTTEPETMPDISDYLHDDETDEDDDNESSKNEEQIAVPSFQSALTGLETVKRFFLCNELQEDSLKKIAVIENAMFMIRTKNTKQSRITNFFL